MEIEVEERIPAVIWRAEEALVLLDGTGHPVAPLSARTERPDLPLIAGVGAGFLPVWQAELHDHLVPVCDAREEWASRIWLITHVDLHRTAKVQSFTQYLKEHAKGWPQGANSAAGTRVQVP